MRTLSLNALLAMHAQETGEVFLVLLTLSHPSLPAAVRATSDAVATTSRGYAFAQFPFLISFPQDNAEELPRAELTIDNVDGSIIQALRSLPSAPNLLIEIVLASNPDLVEASWSMTLREARYDDLSITGTFGAEQFLNAPLPGDLVTPATVPGVF
jgi:hypothetical protein